MSLRDFCKRILNRCTTSQNEEKVLHPNSAFSFDVPYKTGQSPPKKQEVEVLLEDILHRLLLQQVHKNVTNTGKVSFCSVT